MAVQYTQVTVKIMKLPKPVKDLLSNLWMASCFVLEFVSLHSCASLMSQQLTILASLIPHWNLIYYMQPQKCLRQFDEEISAHEVVIGLDAMCNDSA